MSDLIQPWADFGALTSGLLQLHGRAHHAALRSVDELLTLRNWLTGTWIVAYEQNGNDRAQYGAGLIDALAARFKEQGLRGFSTTNLRKYREIALAWPRLAIQRTLSVELLLPDGSALLTPKEQEDSALAWQDDDWMTRLRTELSWSHFLELVRVPDATARAFYELETLKQHWSVRELRRQRESQLYERVGLSKNKDAVLALATEGTLTSTPDALVRDPYVLEFLRLPSRQTYSESELETALMDHLQSFLLELGGDFAFLGRQYRITVGGRHHFIDLLFFHRTLRCLVAVDLKIGSFGYEDAGQMNFYLNVLKEQVAHPDENAPIGIVLCADKDAAEVHYATGGLDQQIFVSRYLTSLPDPEVLKRWLLDEREALEKA